MRKILPLISLLFLLILPGCMSLLGFHVNERGNRIYYGTRTNIEWFVPPWPPFLIPVIDLPLCLVADTVFLPITITQTILDSEDPEVAESEIDGRTKTNDSSNAAPDPVNL